MHKLLIGGLLLAVLTLTSCYQNNKEVTTMPDRLISQDQMIEILTQIQLAEGKVVLDD